MEQSLPNSSILDLSHVVKFLSCSNDAVCLPTHYNFFLAHPYNYEILFYTKFFLTIYFQLEYFPIYGS